MLTSQHNNEAGLLHRSAVGLPRLDVNMDSLLCNLNSAFNPLHRDCLLNYHVRAVDASQVCLSVVMPNEMLRSFSQLLESMGGFFRVANNKARVSSAEIKTHDLNQIADRKQATKDFQEETCKIFDGFIGQGLSVKDGVKQTNIVLKERNHPWASHYIVETTLRAAGRLRKFRARSEVKSFDD